MRVVHDSRIFVHLKFELLFLERCDLNHFIGSTSDPNLNKAVRIDSLHKYQIDYLLKTGMNFKMFQKSFSSILIGLVDVCSCVMQTNGHFVKKRFLAKRIPKRIFPLKSQNQ